MENIWTAEESRAMAVAMTGVGRSNIGAISNDRSLTRHGSANISRVKRKGMDDIWRDIHRVPESNGAGKRQRRESRLRETAFQDFRPTELGLTRHGSSTLAGTGRKTVNNVWQDIHLAPQTNGGGKIQRRQNASGEMTLEDFLSRAGVVRQETDVAQLNPCVSSVPAIPLAMLQPLGMQALTFQNGQNASWLNYGLQQTKSIGSGPGITLSDSMPLSSGPMSSLSPSPSITDSPSGRGKKKDNKDSLLEKSFERRHMRMIKNRESAARSRARKQAYTVELEAEVTQLKEENARLKKEQALERQLPPPQNPRQPIRVLRRTRSTSW